MKKTILLIMMIFSSFVFGNSFEKSFGERITDRIKFGMTKEEFSRSVSKAPLSNSHSKLEGNLCYPSLLSKAPLSNSHDDGRYAVYYYSGVEDPLGIPRNLTSFNYVDNRLVSAIFDSQTTEEEHKKIVKAYSKNQSKLSKEKMKKMETETALLLYNDKKTIEVYRMLDHTFIIVQAATQEGVKNKIRSFQKL